jgi:hypothetical protein
MRGVRLVSVAFVAMLGLVVGAPMVAQAGSAPVLGWTPQTSSSPSTFNFGAVSASGTSQTFTLKNSGGSATSALKLSPIASSSGFSISSDHCTALSLGPKKTCTVQITYTPTGAASDQATLTAMSKKPAATGQIILQGTLATPNVQIVPTGQTSPVSPFDLGAQAPSGVGSQEFTATNIGTAATSTYTFTGPANPAFSVTQDTTTPCDGSALAVNASCTFTVTYTGPADCGTATGFSDSVSLGSYASQAVQGECVLAIAVVPTNHTFVSPATQSFTVANTGNETGSLAAPSVSGDKFSIGSGDTCTAGFFAPGATCSVPVTYSPDTCEYSGFDSGTLDASMSLGASQASTSAPLGGFPTSCVSITPTSHLFGPGSSFTYTVTNNGSQNVTLSPELDFVGGSLNSSSTCGSSLASGGSCTYVVDYHPTACGQTLISGKLRVNVTPETATTSYQITASTNGFLSSCPT